MKVLIVGAGALGQVFGSWLAAGGARVSYLVKPGREKWADGGAPVTRLRSGRAPVTGRLVPYEVMSEAAGTWDMVWLCVDSGALRGETVARLSGSTAGATIVTIGQDLDDLDTLARLWPKERIVQAAPMVLAFPAPSGMTYWTPPGAATGVSGPRAPQVVAALRAGGARARRVRRAGAGEMTAARMIPFIAALEQAGWTLPRLDGAAAAGREAVAVVAARHGRRAALSAPAWAARLALRVLPRLTPFDLWPYLEAHFTKVGAQTRLMLDGWIAEGAARGLPVEHLKALREGLKP
ncbi:ketopantoate reductase family protein [Nonomuraea sp. NPDC048826]|uniref:ketopantoate reductase family protein n=1 Tax=Nonomuraea sp. NPDC048826 TaxID=3364347 RepID=UPI003717D547